MSIVDLLKFLKSTASSQTRCTSQTDVDVCTAKLGDSISSRDGVAVPANNERATVPSSGIKFLVGKCDLDEYFTKLHECQLIFYESDLATNSTAASCKLVATDVWC